MQNLNGSQILETIQDVFDEVKNKALFSKNILSETIAYLMGSEKYTDIDYIIDTDHSLLLSAKNKFKEFIALKLCQAHASQYGMIYSVINQIKVQNHNQFFSYIQVNDIKTFSVQNDILIIYFEEEMCNLSLLDIVLSQKPKSIELDQELKLQIVIKILDSLNYLHKQDLVHGNLKFSNILQQSKIFKLSDQFLNIHDQLKQSSLLSQEEDEESKNIQLQRIICNYSMHPPEIIQKKEPTIQSDIFTLGILLLQLDNIQKFNYANIESIEKDYEKYFSQGQIPPQLQLQSESIFYKLAMNMIKKNPSDRMNCEFYIQKLMLHLKDKKLNMAIRLDSFYVDYQSKIVNNSKLLMQTIQKDQKSNQQLGDQEEEDESIEQLKDEYDEDLSQEFQDQNDNEEEEEKQDKFDDPNDPVLTIENYMTNQQNTQGQEQKQKKKSSFFNIQVFGDENDKISLNEELDNDKVHQPVIVSLNNSKLNLSSRKPQLNHLKVPSYTRLEGQKSKFSSFQQINKSMLEDDNVIGDDNIMDSKSVYSNNKDNDIKSIDQEANATKSYRKQDDELSKYSQVESPVHIKLKKDTPSSQKISANNIQRERLNSQEINKQFEENQKKMSQRKLQIQAQRSNVSQENFSPLQINPSPSLSKDQKNDLILLNKLVQEKKNLIPQLSLVSRIASSNIQSQHQSQRDDSLSQKVSNIATENKMEQKDEILKPEQIEVVDEKVEIIEEQKDNYEVQVKWNQALGKNSRNVLLQGLIYDIEEKNDKLQSLQVDFSRFEQLTDDDATRFLTCLQQSYKSLKQLHLNFYNNDFLTSNFMNLLLQKLAEQQKRCFLFFKNLLGLVDLNLKVDTAKINGQLIQNLIINQSKTLIKLSLTLGRNIIFSNYTADKIIFDVAKCKHLQQILISIAADHEFQNHKKLKMKKIQQISLISNEISYNRFFHNQNLNQIVKKLEEQTFNNNTQNTLKIRIIQNNQQFSPESFSGLLNFIRKFEYLQKLTINMSHRNIQKNQNIEELVEALASLKFLQDLNLNFEQYSVINYEATLPFLKLKDAKIFMKNVIIFSYNGFSFDYVKKHLKKSIKITDQVKVFGFKIPQIFSIDNQIVKLVAAYFYKNTIQNSEIDTSQFDIKRFMNLVDVQIKGSQILIDKVIQTIVHQGEKMEELRLSYKNQSKIDSLDKSIALVHKLKNLKHVEIVQDGWVDMKWIESLLNQFKLIVNIKQIFISNPQIEVKFHEENLLIYSNTQSSLEKVLDFFDDHQDYFQRIKNILIQANHKILYNENLRLRISNILITTKIVIQIVIEHINIENFDQVYQVSDNTFDSNNLSISSEMVTTLIINSQYQQLGTKNQRIICNSFAQFENLQKLTLDLSYCKIHKHGIQILNNSLQLAALLTHLWIDLSFTNLDDKEIIEMIDSIKQINLIQVIMIKLRYTNMKNEGSNAVLSLFNSFDDLQEIELDLSGNNISFEGLKYFEQIQKELPKIKRIFIDLKEDIIEDEGALILKQLFNHLILPNVEYIDLNLNLCKLKINGIKGITSSISGLTTLKYLDLNMSKNYIEDEYTSHLQILTEQLQFIKNLKIIY
ncbi:protein kinase (macronuclear) [Tetrahymena thermophila SB210]|uniref:Protein kinase n=1 Tax=Tetrahymena thermophila (strain SB210) TaxID=312017 RepID=Q228N2_TETTS|nr:protein kinase [Tetrahymena thermophila SB210]EAR81752.2 protein kinase [Tetrahymena thermophila SB210]|eukprot:XP_001029415.2 protein kinase [Tetrahymena thermophila SB210]